MSFCGFSANFVFIKPTIIYHMLPYRHVQASKVKCNNNTIDG